MQQKSFAIAFSNYSSFLKIVISFWRNGLFIVTIYSVDCTVRIPDIPDISQGSLYGHLESDTSVLLEINKLCQHPILICCYSCNSSAQWTCFHFTECQLPPLYQHFHMFTNTIQRKELLDLKSIAHYTILWWIILTVFHLLKCDPTCYYVAHLENLAGLCSILLKSAAQSYPQMHHWGPVLHGKWSRFVHLRSWAHSEGKPSKSK